VCFAVLLSAGGVRAQGASAGCEEVGEIAVLPAPLSPWTGAPLRVIVAAEKPVAAELTLTGPDGSVAAKSHDREGGPPYYWYAEVAAPAAGTWHATLTLDEAPAGCSPISRDVAVGTRKPAGPQETSGSLWPIHNSWNRETENLYSAWVAKMFDGPLDQELSWKTWDGPLHDPTRNMLFNYLGLGEDNVLPGLRPDCADFV
jgi:hypothetical protein